jgi:hypothetical protein
MVEKYEITEGGNELLKGLEGKYYLVKKNRIIWHLFVMNF